MSHMDDAGMAMPEECAALAEVYPMPKIARAETGNGKRPRRPGGNGKRPHVEAQSLRRIVEAVLFASDRPVSLEELAAAAPDRSQADLEQELEVLAEAYEAEDRGFQLQCTGAGYQIQTHPEMHEYVTRFLVGTKRARLSRAAMETLAIVAYRQPITRGEAEQIRGVDCGQVLHTLLDRGLVTVKGRSQALGRPLLYGTTEEFLHYFGIKSLADLPSPEELNDLLGDDPLADDEVRELLVARGFGDEEADGGAGEAAASDQDGLDSEGSPEAPVELDAESGVEVLDESESESSPETPGDRSGAYKPEPIRDDDAGDGYLYASP